ncbi:MAG TPA: aminoglycoside phosphotransferase, partial [Methylobacter sp.]
MTDSDELIDQATLIQGLAEALRQGGAIVQVFETHISWVLISAGFAYKFKKAVQFDFLDFSTLASRHFYCLEEIRLNRRLAPNLYLDVVAVTGSLQHPQLNMPGVPIEYAVRMRAFPQNALWNVRLDDKLLNSEEIDAFSKKIARFHLDANVADSESAWGTPAALRRVANENLETIASSVVDSFEKRMLDEIKAWHIAQQRILEPRFLDRKARGMVRECHGDLHCGNILTLDQQVEIFDCIEFNER